MNNQPGSFVYNQWGTALSSPIACLEERCKNPSYVPDRFEEMLIMQLGEDEPVLILKCEVVAHYAGEELESQAVHTAHWRIKVGEAIWNFTNDRIMGMERSRDST